MRAALLPTGSDPFLVAYWLRHYESWADQVDELRVNVYNVQDKRRADYFRSLAKGNVVITVIPHKLDHGDAIGELVKATSAEYVMLCEDDAFVREPPAIGERFSKLESGDLDIVGCPRSSATPGVINAADAAFGSLPTWNGETGPLLWPCFLFTKRSNLLGKHCGAAGWKAGEQITGTGYTAETDEAADTFGKASLELRAAGLRLAAEPQHRASLPTSKGPWFHVGSLSSGHDYYLNTREQDSFYAAIRNDLHDWNKRMSWWQRVHREWDGRLPAAHFLYGRSIEAFMKGSGMVQGGVDVWTGMFDDLITW